MTILKAIRSEEEVTMDPPHSSHEEILPPKQKPTRKWFKKWVPQETALKSGKCYFLKWVTEDATKASEERSQSQKGEPVVEAVVEPEYEVAFLCSTEKCGQIFTEVAAMRKHAQTHVQFICKYEGCGRRYSDASKLKRHQLTHTRERHFVCPSEGYGKVATPPVEKESANTKIIIPTSGAATLDRPYSCPYNGCKKVYKHEYKLNLHLKREHAGTTFEENEKQVKTNDGEKVTYEGGERHEDAREVGIPAGHGRGKFPIISKSSPVSNMKRGGEQAEAARVVGITGGYVRGKFPIISKPSLVSNMKKNNSKNIVVFNQNRYSNSRAHIGRNDFFAKVEWKKIVKKQKRTGKVQKMKARVTG